MVQFAICIIVCYYYIPNDENHYYIDTHSDNSRCKIKKKTDRRDGMQEGVSSEARTSIQLTPETRDRLFKLKFRRTYDQFLNELCDLYESAEKAKEKTG
jgi:hypothetical protein